MDLRFPHQLFINNRFIDASNGATFDTINPTDETVSALHGENAFVHSQRPLQLRVPATIIE